MDIDLKDRENGIQISMRLREIDPDVCLVFITNLAQYAIQGYRVNAFDYIVKPINEYDFNQRIASISKMIEERKKEKILISNDGAKVAIAIKDIYYVEVANHSLIYHTSKGDFKTYGSLKEVVKEIPLDSIVLETDSPYLAPVPYRGKVNSSKYLIYIAKYISDIKNISVEELAEITSRNASSLFDFDR